MVDVLARPADETEADSPSPELVREMLDRVLAAQEFQSSPQLSAFLRYIVETKLDGAEHILKGQNVGVAVLGRPEGFDAQRDPIVRVEAHRLRRALASYYGSAGSDDLVRIVVKRGSYVPRFEVSESALEDAAGNDNEKGVGIARPLLAIGGLLFLLATIVAGMMLVYRTNTPVTAGRTAVAPVVAATGDLLEPPMPAIRISAFVRPHERELGAQVDQLESDITIALARFPELRVLADPSKPADFELDGEVMVSGQTATVTLRLAAVATSEVLWSLATDLSLRDFAGGEGLDPLAEAATIAIAPQFGAIARYLAGRGGREGTRTADEYRCLVEAQTHTGRADDGSWQRLNLCLRDMLTAYPDFADGLAARSLLLLAGYRRNPDAATATDWFAQAGELARRSLEREPGNVRSMWAETAVAFHKGDLEAAHQMGARAIDANPFDASLRAQYALVLISEGDTTQARRQAAVGQSLDPAHIGIYDALDFLARLNAGTVAGTPAEPISADVPATPYEAIARLIAIDRAGDVGETEKARRDLDAIAPLFGTNRDEAIARLFPDTVFSSQLDAALAHAGVGGQAGQ